MLRSTRASRGEYGSNGQLSAAIIQSEHEIKKYSIRQQHKDIPVRKWNKVDVKIGRLNIPKWVPVSQEHPTQELQAAAAGLKVASIGNKRERETTSSIALAVGNRKKKQAV